ncbi:hypothetical protein Q9306_01505 [Bacillus sp. WLY-B-L8]|nr:hypothetical protein [Bacillus sp. WLY-B-L8]
MAGKGLDRFYAWPDALVSSLKKKGFLACIYIHFDLLTSKLLLCKTKSDMHLFAPFVFTLPVAEKGSDRFKHGQTLSAI